MEPYAISPNTGGPLDPNDVIGRDAICREVLIRMSNGENLRLPDPRRLGKSSLLHRLPLIAVEFTDRVISVVYIDFQGTETMGEFLDRLISALAEHATLGARFKRSADSFIQKAGLEATFGEWTIKPTIASAPAKEVLARIIASIDGKLAEDETVVLACDEVPMAVESILRNRGADEARLLLDVLQHCRKSAKRVRWLLTGSIGLHHITRQVGATEAVYGDTGTQHLGPLATSNAEFLAHCLLLGIRREARPGAVALMADVTGGIPFFLHHLVHGLRGASGAVGPEEASAAFERFINDRDTSSALTHLVTRLDGYYGDDAALAKIALDLLAVSPDPQAFSGLAAKTKAKGDRLERLREVVAWLVDDHYLVGDSVGLRWRYDVLRRVWIARRML